MRIAARVAQRERRGTVDAREERVSSASTQRLVGWILAGAAVAAGAVGAWLWTENGDRIDERDGLYEELRGICIDSTMGMGVDCTDDPVLDAVAAGVLGAIQGGIGAVHRLVRRLDAIEPLHDDRAAVLPLRCPGQPDL